MTNLTAYANSALEAAFTKEIATDFEVFREAASEAAFQEADASVIYTRQALGIISRYESEYGDQAEDLGQTFKADEWETAMTAYAFQIARAVIEAELSEKLDEIEEAKDHIEGLLPEGVELQATDRGSVYGWEAHDREDEEGVCFWHKLEGELDAVELTCHGITFYASWDPSMNVEG